MKRNRIIASVVFMILVVAVSIYGFYTATAPKKLAEGTKTVTLDIVHADGTTKTAELYTQVEFLGEALAEMTDLVVGEQGPYGLFIKTADGESASDADKTFWALKKDGVETATGVDQTPIADGDHFSLELTKY